MVMPKTKAQIPSSVTLGGLNGACGGAEPASRSGGRRRLAATANGSTTKAAARIAHSAGAATATIAEPSRLPAMIPRLQKPWQRFMMIEPVSVSARSASTFKPSSSVDIATPSKARAMNNSTGVREKAGRQTITEKTKNPAMTAVLPPMRETNLPAKGNVDRMPTGMPSRASARSAGPSSRRAWISGMRGNQLPKAIGCRKKIAITSFWKDMRSLAGRITSHSLRSRLALR